MSTEPNQLRQFEGKWEELIRHSDHFAGQRVRITVLHENDSTALASKIRGWLAEGENLTIAPPSDSKPNAFSDGLVEKFRRQGLVF